MQDVPAESNRSGDRLLGRRALTLVELVVVLAILVVLSSLIVPLIQGLGFQTNAATNATVIDDVNRAMGAYAARTGNQPDNWDSLLGTTGSRFTKMRSELAAGASPNLLEDMPLTQIQVDSLNAVGIYNVRDADESSTVAPNSNNATVRKLVDGGKLVKLTPIGIATLGGEFQVVPAGVTTPTAFDLVVLGLGSNVTVQGSTMMQIPLIQNADPANHYARVCCVYQIPVGTATANERFPARYIGCFMPDGTTARKNMENYNSNSISN